MKHIIELETLILAFEEEMQNATNADFAPNKMLLNAINDKMADLAKLQYFYADEAATEFQLKQRIAQLAKFRNKLRNIYKYVYNIKLSEHEGITQTDATILYIFDVLRNIGIEEKRLKRLLPQTEPEQQQTPEQETPHTKLIQKIIDKGLLICFEPEEPDNKILAEQIYVYINNTLEAQKNGKKRYQDILKKGIDEHKNHIFGRFEPYVIIEIFKDFGIELHNDTVSRWRKIWNTTNTDKEQKE